MSYYSLSSDVLGAVLQPSGAGVTLKDLEKLTFKDTLDPRNKEKLTDRDIIVPQGGDVGFGAPGLQNEVMGREVEAGGADLRAQDNTMAGQHLRALCRSPGDTAVQETGPCRRPASCSNSSWKSWAKNI